MDIFKKAVNEATLDLMEECLAPADDDALSRTKAEITALMTGNDALTRIIQADDILEISAELIYPKNKTRLPVADDFVTRIQSRSNCKPNILGFKHVKTGVYKSTQAFGEIADYSGYAPIYQYFCKGHDENTIIGYSANEITVKITQLSHFPDSRYRSLIDSLIALTIDGLITHKARKPVTQRRLYNSIRQIILRRFRVKSYEWGLLFNADISAALMPHLAKIAQRTEQGTFYLYDSDRSQCKIKIYNVTAASDRAGQPVTFQDGDRLKFEITYKTEFFYRQNNLHINSLTIQNDIASLLLDHNKKHLQTHLLDKIGAYNPAGLRRVFESAGVTGRGEFMKLIDDDRTTQVSTDERIRELKSRLDALESLTMARLAEQEAINAQVQADLDALKAAFLSQEKRVDKRKLRVVGK